MKRFIIPIGLIFLVMISVFAEKNWYIATDSTGWWPEDKAESDSQALSFAEKCKEQIKPIGWSEKGYFAFLMVAEWDDRFHAVFKLVDTVSDQVMESGNLFISASETEKIENQYKDWNELAKKHGINGTIQNPGPGTDLYQFPLYHRGIQYNAYFDFYLIKKQVGGYEQKSRRWNLVVESINPYPDTKIIAANPEGEIYDPFYFLIGFFKSPYENRIAVYSTYLNDSGIFRGIINGCHLTSGFKNIKP